MALTGHTRARIHASRSRKARTVGSRSGPWAPDQVGRPNLTRRQEANGVDLIRKELPRNSVARVDPEFVRKKRQNLASLVCALDAGERMPLRCLCACGKKHKCNDQSPRFHTPSSTKELARVGSPTNRREEIRRQGIFCRWSGL